MFELEEEIQDRLEELEELESNIARKEVTEKYIARNTLQKVKDKINEDKNEEMNEVVTENIFINKMK